MNIRLANSQKILVILALIISLILCIELAVRGYDFYFDVLSNVRKTDEDFPKYFGKFRVGLEYLALNAIYLIWLNQSIQDGGFHKFKDILKCAAIFLLIAFASYPISGDVRLYLQYGLMDLNGVNPFITPAGDFNSELSPLLAWQQTSTYGPISQIIFMISAAFVSVSFVAGIYVFKLFCVFFHILNAYLIWKNLSSSSQYRSIVTIAYLVNPFLLFETVVNAHLDVFVATALLVFITCLKYRLYIAGMLVLWAGFLTKTLPIIWLPLVAVFLMRQQRWRSLIMTALILLITVVVLGFTILPSLGAWSSLVNSGVRGWTSGSLHALLSWVFNSQAFLFVPSKNLLLKLFKLILYMVFAAYYLRTLFRIYFERDYSESNLILDIGWITLVLFLFATPWYRPWYSSILLPIAALNLNAQLFVLVSIALSIFGSCSYYLLGANIFFSMLTVVPTIALLLLKPKLLHSRIA
jgi:alpha-1,6-mannosyltransferase